MCQLLQLYARHRSSSYAASIGNSHRQHPMSARRGCYGRSCRLLRQRLRANALSAKDHGHRLKTHRHPRCGSCTVPTVILLHGIIGTRHLALLVSQTFLRPFQLCVGKFMCRRTFSFHLDSSCNGDCQPRQTTWIWAIGLLRLVEQLPTRV